MELYKCYIDLVDFNSRSFFFCTEELEILSKYGISSSNVMTEEISEPIEI
jgi:hypothetical protein